jgi:hypothetical protein
MLWYKPILLNSMRIDFEKPMKVNIYNVGVLTLVKIKRMMQDSNASEI